MSPQLAVLVTCAIVFGPILGAVFIADGITVLRRRLRAEFPEDSW